MVLNQGFSVYESTMIPPLLPRQLNIGFIRLMSTWRNVLQNRVYKVFEFTLSFNKAQDNLLSVKDSPEANLSCP